MFITLASVGVKRPLLPALETARAQLAERGYAFVGEVYDPLYFSIPKERRAGCGRKGDVHAYGLLLTNRERLDWFGRAIERVRHYKP